jgi:hypothetical protein
VCDAERKLWRAVLGQAYEDAEGPPMAGETSAEEPLEVLRARRYLRADSPFEASNLAMVCQFAGFPADRIILWARRRFALAA